MKNIILIIFLILLIIILEILLILNKRYNKYNNIKESLIVSPIKLYNPNDDISNNNKINENLCEVNSNYITMDDYLKIKSSNFKERPASELIGKIIRIFIPIEKESILNINIPSEESNYCFLDNKNTNSKEQCITNTPEFDNLNSNQDETIITNYNSCTGGNFNESDYTNLPPDITFNYNNYFLYSNGGCWFDANIINYLQVDNNRDNSKNDIQCSLHKIAWMDEEKIKYIRWINLNDYKIEVPIMENSVSLNSDLNSSSISENSKAFDFKNNYSLNTSFIDTTCNNNLKINYYGNIDCNTNADCNLNNTSNLKFYCIKNKCSY